MPSWSNLTESETKVRKAEMKRKSLAEEEQQCQEEKLIEHVHDIHAKVNAYANKEHSNNTEIINKYSVAKICKSESKINNLCVNDRKTEYATVHFGSSPEMAQAAPHFSLTKSSKCVESSENCNDRHCDSPLASKVIKIPVPSNITTFYPHSLRVQTSTISSNMISNNLDSIDNYNMSNNNNNNNNEENNAIDGVAFAADKKTVICKKHENVTNGYTNANVGLTVVLDESIKDNPNINSITLNNAKASVDVRPLCHSRYPANLRSVVNGASDANNGVPCEVDANAIDNDTMTSQTTYSSRKNPRPEAGKYVLDPNNSDFSNPRYIPVVLGSPQRAATRSMSSHISAKREENICSQAACSQASQSQAKQLPPIHTAIQANGTTSLRPIIAEWKCSNSRSCRTNEMNACKEESNNRVTGNLNHAGNFSNNVALTRASRNVSLHRRNRSVSKSRRKSVNTLNTIVDSTNTHESKISSCDINNNNNNNNNNNDDILLKEHNVFNSSNEMTSLSDLSVNVTNNEKIINNISTNQNEHTEHQAEITHKAMEVLAVEGLESNVNTITSINEEVISAAPTSEMHLPPSSSCYYSSSESWATSSLSSSTYYAESQIGSFTTPTKSANAHIYLSDRHRMTTNIALPSSKRHGDDDKNTESREEIVDNQLRESVLHNTSKCRKHSHERCRTMQYLVVLPRYRVSAISLFFPIYTKRYNLNSCEINGNDVPRRITDVHPKHDRPELSLASVEIQKNNLNRKCLYKIGPCAVAFKVVLNAFEAAGLRHTQSNTDFNVLWAKRATPYTLASLTSYQKVNHFPGTWGLGRKDSLACNMNRMRRYFGDDKINITPASFIIPRQRDELLWEATRNPPSARKPLIYILKPCASSCGRGIELCHGIPRMPRGGKQVVCQRYIGNPLLIDDRKFDLRLYCVVTGFDPLRIYLFKEGLVRFAASKYTGPDQDLDNVMKHLTNYSINKTTECKQKREGEYDEESCDATGDDLHSTKLTRNDAASCDNDSNTCNNESIKSSSNSGVRATDDNEQSQLIDSSGCNSNKDSSLYKHQTNDLVHDSEVNEADNEVNNIKWSLTQLKDYLTNTHPFGATVWDKIERDCEDVVIKAFLSIESEVVKRIRAECADKTGRNCFELFGLDLMVDDEFKVRLIEVNIMPSLATETPLDKAIKSHMLAHLLTLIRVIPHRRDVLRSDMRNEHKRTFIPHGALPTRPETIYKFGKHPNGSALMVEHNLLTTFNRHKDVHSLLSVEECVMLIEAEEELHCCGDFRRIFPHADTLEQYLPLFTNGVRRNNFLLCSAAKMQNNSN